MQRRGRLWVLTDVPMHQQSILGFVVLAVHALSTCLPASRHLVLSCGPNIITVWAWVWYLYSKTWQQICMYSNRVQTVVCFFYDKGVTFHNCGWSQRGNIIKLFFDAFKKHLVFWNCFPAITISSTCATLTSAGQQVEIIALSVLWSITLLFVWQQTITL